VDERRYPVVCNAEEKPVELLKLGGPVATHVANLMHKAHVQVRICRTAKTCLTSLGITAMSSSFY
jgi:hypothetical protein